MVIGEATMMATEAVSAEFIDKQADVTCVKQVGATLQTVMCRC